METHHEATSSSVVLTRGNAQELSTGPSNRPYIRSHRDTNNQPRPPSRGDQGQGKRPVGEDSAIDPLTLGFDRIMGRFDQIESRMDNLETPIDPDSDSGEEGYESDDRDYAEYRNDARHHRNTVSHRLPSRVRATRPPDRGRREAITYRGGHTRRGSPRGYDSGQTLASTYLRRTSTWDPPAARRRHGREQRRHTA